MMWQRTGFFLAKSIQFLRASARCRMPIYALSLALAENARLTFPITLALDYQNALARVYQRVPTCILEFCHLHFKPFLEWLLNSPHPGY